MTRFTCACAWWQVLGERDAVVQQLQAAVVRREGAAVSARAGEAQLAEVQRLREERDEAQGRLGQVEGQLEALKGKHQVAMEALRGQIERTNSEHEMLERDRQRLIEQLKAKLIALEAQLHRSHHHAARHEASALDDDATSPPREAQGTRLRVLPPPPSPNADEQAPGEMLDPDSPPLARANSAQGSTRTARDQAAEAEVHGEEQAGEVPAAQLQGMVELLRAELHGATKVSVCLQKKQVGAHAAVSAREPCNGSTHTCMHASGSCATTTALAGGAADACV